MKNLVFLLAALVFGTGTSFGANMRSAAAASGNARSFIFTEGDITFSVYPDGEFDFYLNSQVGFQAGGFAGQGAITFNSGYNYNPYVQYDDFGAVIQISQLPVYYDYYGRVNRIGNVHMTYRNGRLYRLGGMRIFYNGFGYYNYHLGYINPYNRAYVYRPFHRYFIRPAAAFCMVYPRPYRHYYYPVRYTYHRPYTNNARRAYAHAGKPYKYQNRPERSRVYKNDRRVVARNAVAGRSTSGSVAGRTSVDRTNRTNSVQRSAISQAGPVVRTKSSVKNGRSIANTRRNTSAVRAKGNAKNSRGIAGTRTSSRMATRVSAPSKSLRNQITSRSAKKERAGRSVESRGRSQTTKKGTAVRSSREQMSRSAAATRSSGNQKARTSRRGTGY